MTRKAEISEKIAYAFERQQALAREVNAVALDGTDVPYVGVKVGEILSACRECLDYCIKDLAEKYRPGFDKNVYFPLTMDALTKKPIKDWETTEPKLYATLLHLVDLFTGSGLIPGTIFRYSIVKETNEIVNAKKHDVITKAKRCTNSSTLVSFGNGAQMIMSPVFTFSDDGPDFGADVGAQEMVGSNDSVEIKYIDEYRLEVNGWEIVRYCDHAIQSSWRVLDSVYMEHLDGADETFDPCETLKSPSEKKFDAALRAVAPMVSRPLRFVLYNGDVEVRNIVLDFDGEVDSRLSSDVELGKDLFDAFVLVGWPMMEQKLLAFLREDPCRIPTDVLTPRYFEMEWLLENCGEVTSITGEKLSYTRMLIGIGTKFKADPAEILHRGRDMTDHARAQRIFGIVMPKDFAIALKPL